MEKKMVQAEFKKTPYKGITYLVKTRDGRNERIFYARWRGEPTETCKSGYFYEPVGGSIKDRMTAAKARDIRERRMSGTEKTNAERRAERKAKEKVKVSAPALNTSNPTFNDLWSLWQADPENKGKRGTLKANQRYRKHVAPVFGDRQPSDLLPSDVDELRLSLAEKHSKQTTISVLGLVTRLARYGASKGVCAGLSFPVILKGKKLGREPKRKAAPTPEQVQAYIQTCKEWDDPQAGNFQLFIVYTGIRRGSVRELKWTDIDFDERTALLRDSKTGDVTITLSDPAIDLLQSHPETLGNPFVFTGTRPDGARSDKKINTVPGMIRDEAGLPKDFDPCHGFRRNLATTLDRAGVSIKQIMEAGGWKTPQMVIHYTAPTKATRESVANKFGELVTGNGKDEA